MNFGTLGAGFGGLGRGGAAPEPPNLLQKTDAFNDAYWLKAFVTVTANAGVGPSGSTTAELMSEDTNNNVHVVYKTISLAAGIYTLSTFFKPDALTRGALCLSSPDGSKFTALINAQTGVIIETHDTGTPVSSAAEIVAAGQGFYRIGVTMYCTTGSVGINIATAASDTPAYAASGVPTYLGTSSGIYIAGAQLELSPSMTSYKPVA